MLAEKNYCFGCQACEYICPVNAIRMAQDKEGFLYPLVDDQLCINCDQCNEICPEGKELQHNEVAYYALRCSDEKLLYKSSSGGAFSLIAENIISKGGLVCGAVFDEAFNVVHILSDDVRKMRKSKYVQSRISCYEDIEEALRLNRKVLFSGTPCQCHAAKLIFGESSDFYTLSLICRGVMSPLLWNKYLRYLEQNNGEKVADFCFRDKRSANNGHTVAYYIGTKERASDYSKNPLMRIYSKELPLRPSCYKCPYCCPEKDFDFTIGDFWGVEKVFPDLADGKGTSLVIAGSQAAAAILEELTSEADIRQTDKNASLQIALLSPPKESLLRRFLFKDLASSNNDDQSIMELIIKKFGI